MPARISLSNEKMLAALEATGWHVAAAAKRLGISSKTLRRRIKGDCNVRPGPAWHPVWEKASKGNAALLDGSDPKMAGDDPEERYVNHLAQVGGWYEHEHDREPRLLNDVEAAALAKLIADQQDRWEEVDAASTLAEYRDHSWIRRLDPGDLAWLRISVSEIIDKAEASPQS